MDLLGFLFVMDPFFATVIVGAILVGSGFFLGKNAAQNSREEVMSHTIDFLCEEGYLFYRETDDGDVELFKIKDMKENETI